MYIMRYCKLKNMFHLSIFEVAVMNRAYQNWAYFPTSDGYDRLASCVLRKHAH